METQDQKMSIMIKKTYLIQELVLEKVMVMPWELMGLEEMHFRQIMAIFLMKIK